MTDVEQNLNLVLQNCTDLHYRRLFSNMISGGLRFLKRQYRQNWSSIYLVCKRESKVLQEKSLCVLCEEERKAVRVYKEVL